MLYLIYPQKIIEIRWLGIEEQCTQRYHFIVAVNTWTFSTACLPQVEQTQRNTSSVLIMINVEEFVNSTLVINLSMTATARVLDRILSLEIYKFGNYDYKSEMYYSGLYICRP